MFDPHNSMLDSFFEDPHVLVSLLVSGNEASGFVLAPRIWSNKLGLWRYQIVNSDNVKLWHKDRRKGGFQVCSPQISLGSVVYIDSPQISLWTYMKIYHVWREGFHHPTTWYTTVCYVGMEKSGRFATCNWGGGGVLVALPISSFKST